VGKRRFWPKRRKGFNSTMYVVPIRDGAIIPKYQTEEAAGFDLHACLPCDSWAILPGEEREIPCGIVVAIEPGYELQIRSRSGLRFKWKIKAYHGTIDSDFRGELTVLLENHRKVFSFTVKNGMRIAQGVIAPVLQADIVPLASVDELPPSERGANGFGSTGLD